MKETEAPKEATAETKALATEETNPLTVEEFVDRVRVAGFAPMKEALGEYVTRVKTIGKTFLDAFEGTPKKKG